MRRPPRDGDRPFYWSYCYSDTEYKAATIRLMLRAGSPQRLIHIYQRTGFMVSKEGYKKLTKEEKGEIKLAGSEYDALREKSKDDIYKMADFDDLAMEDNDPLINALYIFGNFIERNVNSSKRPY
jgi:hypothetical protein